MEIYRAYKLCIKPTEAQVAEIENTFRCCRFVWNHFLERKSKAYQRRGESLSYFGMKKLLTEMKAYLPWLGSCNRHALDFTVQHLCDAYDGFFRRCKKGKGKVGYPRFKGRKNPKQSFTTDGSVIVAEKFVQIPSIGKVKRGKDKRAVTGVPVNVTVSRSATGKYWASVLCKEEVEPLPVLNTEVGIDVGLHVFAADSDGNTYENPHCLTHSEKRLAREQRKLSRMRKGSSNYEKQRRKVATIHERVVNQRRDYTHKLSRKLVDENQVIAVEDLNIKGMVKNHKKAKAVADVSWAEFFRMLEYKSQWAGRTFIQIDRFYPSSQTCSSCGYKNAAVKDEKVREWTCTQCGAHHDRDINAAINILRKAKDTCTAA